MSVQVKASIWFLICSFLQKGISSITVPIFTRLLDTAEYGNYNVFNSWLGIVTVIVTLNLSAGVYTQGLVKFDKEKNIFMSSVPGLMTAMVALWTVIYLLFHNFWNSIFSLTTVQMLAMLVMIWATAAFSFWAAEQRVQYKYVTLVIVTIAVSLAKPLVGIFFVIYSDDKVTARILGLALVEIIGYTGLFISQMIRGKKFFSAKFWKYALLYNIPLVPHYLSQTVLSSADQIMIKKMVGEDEAGIYGLAYSVALIMTLFNTALSQTISPWVYQKIKDKKIKEISSTAYVCLIIIAAVNVLLIAFAPEVVAIFAPEKYHAAIWVIPPVAMSVYFMFSYDLFAKFAFYCEKTGFIMTASILGAALNLVLNYIFINKFGYVAAGYTTLICYIIYAAGHYIFMKRVCKMFLDNVKPYSLKMYLFITAAFMCIGFLLIITYNIPVVRYGFIVVFIIVAVIFRKRIISTVKQIMAIKKKKN